MYIGEHMASNTPISTFQVIDNKLTFKKDDTYYYYSIPEKKFFRDENKASNINLELTSNVGFQFHDLLYDLKFPYFYSEEYSIVYSSTGIYSFRERKFVHNRQHTFTSSNLYSKGIKVYYNTTKIDDLLNYLYQHFFCEWAISIEEFKIVQNLVEHLNRYEFEEIWQCVDYLNERLENIGQIINTGGEFLFLNVLGAFLNKGGGSYHIFELDGIKQEEIKFYTLESLLYVIHEQYNLGKYFDAISNS